MNIQGNYLRRALRKVLAGALVAAASAVVLVPAVPAQAAASTWGFGFLNNPAPAPGYALPLATEASSANQGAKVTAHHAGFYQVTFYGIGTPPAAGASPGVVHVTAAPVKAAPVWCQAGGWRPVNGNEVIDVFCNQTLAGVTQPQNTDFSVAFSWWAGASAGHYGYLESKAGGGTVTQYHSAGGRITSLRVAAGKWRVTMPGLGGPAPQGGSIQVTPATGSPVHCKVMNWTSSPSEQLIYVICFTPAGAPASVPWNLTYQLGHDITGRIPPTDFGYVWNTLTPPPPTNYNSCPAGAVNRVTPPPPGYTVTFPCIFAPKNNVLLSASGPASGPNQDFCNMTGPAPWSQSGTAVVVLDVRCWTVLGGPSPADDFFATYTAG
jgi:hypothetical protein